MSELNYLYSIALSNSDYPFKGKEVAYYVILERFKKDNFVIDNLNKQLQAYKDKEDKLRELANKIKVAKETKERIWFYDNFELSNEVLQILNEGSNE